MHITVLGAGGHIGSTVTKKLATQGHRVLAFRKEDYDVVIPPSFFPMQKRSTDAVIYCVGHCPPGGFREAVGTPLSQYSRTAFDKEIECHQLGVLYTFQQFLLALRDSGCFSFMSSAATRLLQMPRETRPPIQIYHHLAVIAAENALIEGMRMDPEVKDRGIKIHRIAPPAIGDSPFHKGGPKPQVTVTTAQVVDAIVDTLKATDHQDVQEEFLPK